jgi:hypothetical protein
MNKFNYKNLANYLLDSLLDVYNLYEVLKILIGGEFETAFLLELGFSIDDIELTKKEIEKEAKNYE